MEYTGTNILEFSSLFANDEDCKKYLTERKWGKGFVCPKCQHDKCYPSTNGLNMSCTKCKHNDSSTAGTLFHKVKFGLRKVALTEQNKIKRAYFAVIDDYSFRSLRKLFDDHISSETEVLTDKWKGYSPLAKEWHIEQVKSNGGMNFKELHTIVLQVKSWLRTIPTHVSKKHAQKYFDEFSFRLNRSIYKDTIFSKLIGRMLKHQQIIFQDIRCT